MTEICMTTALLGLCAIPTLLWMVTYFGPILVMNLLPVPDLKKKYNAEWALVTGAGSGIGRELVFKLARQGFNVVLVSLDDKFLAETMDLVTSQFPSQEFRKVGCLFAPGQKYMKLIERKTADIDVQCIFNNAGYLVTGFFDREASTKQLGNLECNTTAAVAVTHHFLGKLVDKKLKGCIVFTSSVAGYIPSPFSSVYGATKAFLSQFACCIAVEAAPCGIDVCSVHPSPVNSNFYDKVHKIDMLEKAKAAAVTPDVLPDQIFGAIGRVVLRDMGVFAIAIRLLVSIMSYNFLTQAFCAFAPTMPDFKKFGADRLKK
uniref:Uncharacterized protein n=1 Tax=Phaeomonas parva TaxID=124430 RepID=A0A7S1XLR4_9STRA|eukprot:CAMPEP_0118878320 /NCGR_PEP_ID=MMETSP1163-20130328/18265_1 /TAXON_ID=124430 /ORGANISM="Phaeomonas parva, Strain CCMP2877" /LENGTH=316 /DNA_ID=CAMNT_0006814129 /DNA_START=86 /DNA_END=1036 /DNA_ORIENTATION=-